MDVKFVVDRLIAVPLRHKVIAAGIAVVLITGCLVWVTHLPPQEYTSSSLLSFDETSVAKLPDPDVIGTDKMPVTELAYSILNDDVVNALCKHFALFPDSNGGAAERFRSNLLFSPVSTSNLRVTWSGADRRQTVTVTNTVAALLASWVPDDATHHLADQASPVPASPDRPITSMAPIEPPQFAEVPGGLSRAEARREADRNDQKKIRFELATADHRLAMLREEARRLEARVRQINAERQANLNARQPLTVQLEAEKKNLDKLSVRYTDIYPDVIAAHERITETEQKLAAMPAVHSAPDAYQSRLNSATEEMKRLGAQRSRLADQFSKRATLETNTRSQEVKDSRQATRSEQTSTRQQSQRTRRPLPLHEDTTASSQTRGSTAVDQVRPFKILQRADYAQPANNPLHALKWLLVLAASLPGIMYQLLAAWWFRAVPDVETLRKIMPGNISYLGAIPGMNI